MEEVMMMSNSSLVNYTLLSLNRGNYDKWGTRYDGRDGAKIDKITIHHVAGITSVETLGNIFSTASRGASSNYGIGNDGKIGLFVEEKNRAWTSSSADNDNRAVTIEVSNSEIGGNWRISEKAMTSLINLCVDICKRNGIAKLTWTGDASGNLTVHRFFAQTACPGPYLFGKMPWIASEVNRKLTESKTTITAGDTVKIAYGAVYPNGKRIPDRITAQVWSVRYTGSGKACLYQSADSKDILNAEVQVKYLTKVTGKDTQKNATASAGFKKGDKVKLAMNAPIYGESKAFALFVYLRAVYLIEDPRGDRAVFSTTPNGPATGAVSTKYLKKV